ncbi:MAG: TPM domain-containing protein [Flavobacterium sp.]|uniref:TPM domain-containing protein n=1 Tax=Flavobacterium sp. TaxID=239 RepID=UPI0022C1A62A|nr:TPM domain-containing protein [Flavobacterium sp.]MCZ8197426.1 TPM domain-containing protein [Flavobacterium sp.]
MKNPINKIPNSNWIFQFTFLFILFASNLAFSQFKIPEKPSFQTSVYDYAKLLSDTEKSQLEEKLIKYSDSTTTQIVVVTVPTIEGEDIGILAPKWGHEWGIGQAKEDNGVFILLAAQERKIWIAPGYGVEDKLVAGITGEIVRNTIIPEFKAGSYYNGLDKGADAIFQVLTGKYKGSRIQDDGKGSFLPILIFIILFIIIIAIISKNKGGNSGNSGGSGPSLLDIIILSNMGRSSGGSFGGGGFGGSSGGGGFGGGFGGGGFSGGGAGGDW